MTTKETAKEIEKMLAFVPQVGNLFNVIEKVGEGTFSKVYRAQIKGGGTFDQEYALKYLVPTSRPSRIASELQCLKEIGGTNNIVGVEHCIMNKGHVVIVMPYFPHERFADYLKSMTTEDTKDYMKNLFIALAKVHENGIIHRDVKPNNFLYDRQQKRYALVDFGLAQRVKIPQYSYEIVSAKPGLPLKEHNSDPMRERLNKSEPNSSCVGADSKGSTAQQDTMKRPCQSTPVLGSKKRPLHFNQENHEHQSKKKPPALDLRNDVWQPLSSRVNILPTPPQTPSSSFSNRSKIKTTKLTIGPDFSNKNVVCQKKSCSCFGKDTVCKLCLSRVVEEAPRGGTPGFRAPEVLLKHREQSTAIDMWSAGVILLSILSHKYPFFRAEDDLSALAEMVYIVGAKQLKEAASSIGKSVLLSLPRASEEVTEIRNRLQASRYFQALCARLRFAEEQIASEKKAKQNSHKGTFQKIDPQHFKKRMVSEVPESAYDLLNRLLDPNPFTRIAASEALLHPFILGT